MLPSVTEMLVLETVTPAVSLSVDVTVILEILILLYALSPLLAEKVIELVTVPSATLLLTDVTYTVWALFQSEAVKLKVVLEITTRELLVEMVIFTVVLEKKKKTTVKDP